MPIYAYKCGACGYSRDVLQKLSDAPLTVCPACGAEAFSKQLTAAGFQLKGTGWYATDFSGKKPAADPAGDSAAPAETKPDVAPAAATDAQPAAPATASAPAPAATPAAAPASTGGASGA